MNPRQRATNAINARQVDRLSFLPLIDLSYAAAIANTEVSQCFLDPVKHAMALEAVIDHHKDIDGFSINISLDKDIITSRTTTADRHIVETTGGLTWNIPVNDIGSVKETEITSFDDPRIETDDPFSPGIINTLKALPINIREKYFVLTGVTGPFSQIAFLMGLEKVMMATVDAPDELYKAIEKRLPFALKWIDTMVKYDPAGIWIGEGIASASLISPETYRKFVLPFEQVLFDQLHQLRIPSVLHICGRLDGILDIVPESGCDCLELDWQVDLADAARKIGDKVTLKGNMNTSTLVQADKAEITKLSFDSIEKAKPARSYILSSGCCIGRDTPSENIEAMSFVAMNHKTQTIKS